MQDFNPGNTGTSVTSLWSNPNSTGVHLRCSPGVKAHWADVGRGGGGGGGVGGGGGGGGGEGGERGGYFWEG